MNNKRRTVKLWIPDNSKPFDVELEIAQDDSRIRKLLSEALGNLIARADIERKNDEQGNLSEVHIVKHPGTKGAPELSLALAAEGRPNAGPDVRLNLEAEIISDSRLTEAEKNFLLNELPLLSDDEWEPVSCMGEPVAETIIRDRGAR